jgi:plastocyanin
VRQKNFAVLVLAVPLLVVFACGGYGSSPTTPTGSEGQTTAPEGAIVVNIIRENGAQSFSPDPATIAVGRMVSWHNTDSVTHRVVLDDGRLDVGNVGAGRFSPAMALPAVGAYHCSIHPSMVGRIVLNAAAAQ